MKKKVMKRQLKVYYGFHRKSYKKHPVIHLAGNYLTKIGFNTGDIIEVTLFENVVTIRKNNPS